jgi:hypothetical protein
MLKHTRAQADGRCMERFIGLVLFIAAIYVATTVATEGLDHAFGGLFAGAPQIIAEGVVQADNQDGAAALPSRRPLTERVRAQVQGDVDDYSARVGAD